MRIVIRVDSSHEIGTGHVMRCLSLANGLRQMSATSLKRGKSAGSATEVIFCCRDLTGNINSVIVQGGFKLIVVGSSSEDASVVREGHDAISVGSKEESTSNQSMYSHWLPVSEEKDAEEFIASIDGTLDEEVFQNRSKIDILIVDHYGLALAWEKKVRSYCEKLIVIDDLVRSHDPDVLIDQTYMREPDEYHSVNDFSGQVLAGTDFAMLRPEFNQIREGVDWGVLFNQYDIQKSEQHRLLIAMGGVDSPNATLRVLEALSKAELSWVREIDVVLSEAAPHYDQVRRFVGELERASPAVRLISFTKDMAKLMKSASIAIGAPGTTTWERACMGLPSILIPIAENQLGIASIFKKADISKIINLEDIATLLLPSLKSIRNDWANNSRKNLKVCDGLGVGRICQFLNPPLANNGLPVYLRKATQKDIERVYEWQCEPLTRKFSRKTEVPSWDEHAKWMCGKLSDPFVYFYIIMHEGVPSGVVRLDKIDGERTNQGFNCYEVSIYLTERKTRLGLAKKVLGLVSKLHCHVGLYATVLPENNASVALFESAGYQKVSDNEYKYVGLMA